MFIAAKNEQSKILMGMLSYATDLVDINAVQREIEWYEHNEQRQLLLWRTNNEQYPVCLGIESLYGTVLVRRIIFNPSLSAGERLALGKEILHELELRFPDEGIIGTIVTQPVLNDWREN